MGSIKGTQNLSWTGNEETLPIFARELVQLKNVRCFLLEGPMGAGKSTLAREVIRALGYPAYQGGSPTFPIWIPVEGSRIHHLDFYRLENEDELESRGLNEILWDPQAIILVEWLSKFPKTYRKLRMNTGSLLIKIDFIVEEARSRKIEIQI